MKLNAGKIRECADWVRENGLMDCGGASLKDFCEAMGINKDTYYQWLGKSDFSDQIEKAKADFKERAVTSLVETVLRKAQGGIPYRKVRRRKEYLPTEDGGAGQLAKLIEDEETGESAPDLGAAIFLLTNIAPDRWVNPQRVSVEGRIATDIELRPLTDEEVERVKASWKSKEKKEGGK